MLQDGMHFLPWQGYKIVGNFSCWRTVCFGEVQVIVQLLSRIWLYWSFLCNSVLGEFW